jgi:sulfoxide reductase heme-binding subunit YedZ
MSRERVLKWIAKPLVFLLCLLPVLLTYNYLTSGLSFNPVDDVTDISGRWTLRFLLITLAITPLRKISGFNQLTRFRRMIGLFAFFYAMIHLAMHAVFTFGTPNPDSILGFSFDVRALLLDIPERPFILAGFIAWVTMLPLALTSTKGWIRRIGGRRWQLLHCLIYVSAIAAVTHYFMNYKLAEPGPILYIGIVTLLLGFRLVNRIRAIRRRSEPSTA